MSLLQEGILKSIEDTQVISDKFKKREFVIETNEQYPQQIKFEFVNDNVDVLDGFNIGEHVKVAFTIRGNEYKGKIYNNLRGIAIGSINETTTTEKTTKVETTPKPSNIQPVITDVDNDDDDLPF